MPFRIARSGDGKHLKEVYSCLMKTIINCIIGFAVALLAAQIVQAQGTMTYLSNLGQSSAGSLAVGNNSWLAEVFVTGTNASGYSLNSIQLGMADSSGNPSNFTTMLYSSAGASFLPGFSLGTLDSSLNPTAAGTYTFTSASNLMLSPSTDYFIVLTAGTAVANGSYEWSYTGANFYNPSGGWASLGNVWILNDGSHWNSTGDSVQFAINATPIPEPGVLGLFGLGGLAFVWHRWKAKTV